MRIDFNQSSWVNQNSTTMEDWRSLMINTSVTIIVRDTSSSRHSAPGSKPRRITGAYLVVSDLRSETKISRFEFDC